MRKPDKSETSPEKSEKSPEEKRREKRSRCFYIRTYIYIYIYTYVHRTRTNFAVPGNDNLFGGVGRRTAVRRPWGLGSLPTPPHWALS